MMALRLRTTAFFSNTRALLDRCQSSPAMIVSSQRQGFGGQGPGAGGDDTEVDETKAKINSAWNASAGGYVDNIQGGGGVKSGYPGAMVTQGMSVGYKLAARIVADKANKMNLKGSGAPVVLDVASAGGEPAITIAKAIPGASVHATDFAPAMMDLIRRRTSEAGVTNVTAGVADAEALTEFGDRSVDAVTCTWGLMFMPQWQRAIQEFSRVLKTDGVVALALWEKYEGSIFERLRHVVDTLDPGYEGLIDPESLGEDGGSAVAEEMRAAGLRDVSVSRFSVPVTLLPHGRPRHLLEYYTSASPLGQVLDRLEAKGRTDVRQEAADIFEGRMAKEWEQGQEPLGLSKFSDDDDRDHGSSRENPASSGPPHVFYARAFFLTGRKSDVAI